MKPITIGMDEYLKLGPEFRKESDRGAAVLAGSYVETLLGGLLKNAMTDASNLDELFGSNGPLSTFSQRVHIAQAFGVIPTWVASTLLQVKAIRNHFAHHPLSATFDDDKVARHVQALKAAIPFAKLMSNTRVMTNRDWYMLACGAFAAGASFWIDNKKLGMMELSWGAG